MKQRLWWIINGFLVCAVFAGVYLHASLRAGDPPVPQASASAPLPAGLLGVAAEAPGVPAGEASGATGPVRQVAGLLGYRPAPAPPADAPPAEAEEDASAGPEPEPLVVEWLSYVGVVTAADGVELRYFKDSRSGRIIRPVDREGGSSWLLEEERKDGFILSRDAVQYWVSR